MKYTSYTHEIGLIDVDIDVGIAVNDLGDPVNGLGGAVTEFGVVIGFGCGVTEFGDAVNG